MTEKRESIVGAGIVLMVLALLFLILISIVAWYLYSHPDVVDVLVSSIVIILLVIVAISILGAIATGLIAIPMYMYKGKSTQTDVSYSLDDVKSVKESSSEEKDDDKDWRY